VVAIAVVIFIVAMVIATRGRRDSDRLKQRFGPEYDRTASRRPDRKSVV
jgi:hypothetical protein